jgi:hypothetical protein
MSRLIDAEVLKKHYSWWNNEEKELFDAIVDAQPTAYSVESVVEQIDDFEIRCCDCQESCNTEGCLIERIKNVILNGGKE